MDGVPELLEKHSLFKCVFGGFLFGKPTNDPGKALENLDSPFESLGFHRHHPIWFIDVYTMQ